ncbi:MAG: hypothetical protein KC910_31710 [Candidatus Eremiobacteraeota bacterium]|nr:hypothetical protein [Candidatus Eremiobacteraeota bacterium]
MRIQALTPSYNYQPRTAASPPPSNNGPQDQVTISRRQQGRALEWAGFAGMMVGGSLVVADSIGLMSAGGGLGLAIAAGGAVAMVAGRYMQN